MKEMILKHKVPVIIIAALLLVVLGFAVGMLAKSSLAKDGDYIGMEKARTIALESVGVSAEKAVFTKAELDQDDMPPTYEIEFYTGVNAYEFEIHALTGDILEKQSEAIHSGTARTSSGQSPQNTESASNAAQAGSVSQGQDALAANYIGMDKAKSIALDRAGIAASDAVFTKAGLSSDDGTQIYEIEFICQNTEYEFELSAYSGDILEYSTKQINHDEHHDQHHDSTYNSHHDWD